MIYKNRYLSPIGGILMESDGEALTGLYFEKPQDLDDLQEGGEDLSVFNQTRRWLDDYFEGQAPEFTPPLRAEGSPFCKSVWEILLTIPFGETTTYGEIAACIAKQRGIRKMSAQAVGGAVSRNPIALIIPCHRVIGSGGDLTGYAGGLDRKAWLLELEKQSIQAMRRSHLR